jgi:NAD+ synthase (glutamine-hydrolysing)
MGVSMPARYSSQGSLSDAEALAKNLGIRYEVIAHRIRLQSHGRAVGGRVRGNEAE